MEKEYSLRDEMAIAIFASLVPYIYTNGTNDLIDMGNLNWVKQFNKKSGDHMRTAYYLADMMREVRLEAFK